MTIDLKHLLPLLVQIAACIVVIGASIGAVKRMVAMRGEIPFTEAGYFLAGCGVLLWGVR